MANHHDTHQQQGGGFWGCANLVFAAFFGSFAAIAGGALIYGGLTKDAKKSAPVAATPAGAAAAAPMAGAPAAAAPAGAPALPAPAPIVVSGDTVTVTIRPGSTGMSYDITNISAKAGQKVKITFVNQHPLVPLQHNIIIGKIGSRENLQKAALAMMTADLPKWMEKGFIPETPDVLHHTKLVNAGETVVLEFVAGPDKGDYPYLCTFPGHSVSMQGTLKVE
jgi:azurin